MNKPLLKQHFHGIYLITDHQNLTDEKLVSDVAAGLAGGASIVQYRDKSGDPVKQLRQAMRLRELTHQYNALLIINDNAELAHKVNADGVHIGKFDHNILQARKKLGDKALIGISCYNQLELAVQAQSDGADYVAFGRFFPSTTKPDAVQAYPQLIVLAKDRLDIPIVAIGGITPDNARVLIEAGANTLAVIKAVFGQQDIEKATRRFTKLFTQQG